MFNSARLILTAILMRLDSVTTEIRKKLKPQNGRGAEKIDNRIEITSIIIGTPVSNGG